MRSAFIGALAVALAWAASSPSAMAQEKPKSRPASQPAASPFPALGDPAGVYGAGVTLDQGMGLAEAAAKIDKAHGRPIRIDGKIDDVCKKKGCWMVLKDGDEQVRVKFKGYKFFVPRDAHDREVSVEGILTKKEISEEEAKHYAEESGDPEAAKAIKGPQQVLAFMATGVEILGARKLPPEAKPEGDAQAKALEERLAKAKPIGKAKAAIKSLEAALEVLRSVKGPRTVEFSLCTQQGEWLVFSKAGGKAFEHGFAVRGDQVFGF